jgi:hypothetical protein
MKDEKKAITELSRKLKDFAGILRFVLGILGGVGFL